MKAEKLRELTVDELKLQESQLTDQIFRLRFQIAAGQSENPTRVHLLRKDNNRALAAYDKAIKANDGFFYSYLRKGQMEFGRKKWNWEAHGRITSPGRAI